MAVNIDQEVFKEQYSVGNLKSESGKHIYYMHAYYIDEADVIQFVNEIK